MDKSYIFTLLKFNSTKPNSLIGHIFYNLHKFAPASEMPSESQQVSVLLCCVCTWLDIFITIGVFFLSILVFMNQHTKHISCYCRHFLESWMESRRSKIRAKNRLRVSRLSSFVLFALSMFRYLPKAFFIFFKKKIRLRPDSPSRC